MQPIPNFHSWLAFVLCWTAISISPAGVAAQTATGGRVKVMVFFQEVGAAGIQTVETVLSRAFERHGYSVFDRDTVAQTLRREADLLQLYEIEAAKQLGARLGAEIVVSGRSQVRTQDKTYDSLGGKRVTVSQADVSAKAILASSGRVLVAETETGQKRPFDMTGERALEKAAEALAGKLIEGIERFLNRDTVDYRLVLLSLDHGQALAFQDALHRQVQGVRQVHERGFAQRTLELDVSVEKQHDLAFKRTVFAGFSGLGLGHFAVVAREGETIFLQTTAGEKSPRPAVPKAGAIPPPASDQSPTRRTEPQAGEAALPAGSAPYKAGYGKSWAVVIGINNYQKWPKLAYAVKDAQEVIKRLKELGFTEVLPLLDHEATQQKILQVLGDELYTRTDNEDRVLIFFAGHGQTQDLPNGSKVGYIIPVDGDQKHYYSTAISMQQLQELSNRLRAKHIFYAIDSCFSGLLLPRGGAAADDAFARLTAVRARQVLTAGSQGEEVVEVGGHGLFTKVLLEGLHGGADLNNDGYITGTELYRFVPPRVSQESRNTQNPQFGQLGSDRGNFVFVLHR
jgi:hypothetical protein